MGFIIYIKMHKTEAYIKMRVEVVSHGSNQLFFDKGNRSTIQWMKYFMIKLKAKELIFLPVL